MHTNDSDFVPPHCPNPNCQHHRRLSPGWRFKRIGYYRRQLNPTRIQRFLCLHCRRSFSTQTFATNYWLKRPDILPQLLTKTTGCMANRQIARDLHVAPSTIDRQLGRLGRHCLLFHALQMQTAKPASRFAIDGFVYFEHSQYYPFHHHLAIEPDTDFMVYFTDSEMRRSGTMTKAQKRKRQRLEKIHGRPDPRAVFKDVRHLLEVVTGGQPRVTVLSDDHQAYPKALQTLPCESTHLVTSSKERRDAGNPLFPINLADLLIRHSSANHKRETIAWSKRRQRSAERLAVFLVWRNYMKGRREKERGSPTPAQARGMMEHRVSMHELLSRRLFVNRIGLPARWVEYYWGRVSTRVLARQRQHELSYAM
ncbi:MAG: IS1 family transposase [bacterium]|nr:IS1 family transposase [bacterium]